MADRKYKAAEVIEAIRGSGGVKAKIAERLGCHRNTVSNYIDNYATVAEAYEEETATTLDEAEHQLIKAVRNGEPWAVKYTLSTKGKERGYTERQEITGAEGGALIVEFVNDWRNVGDETED